MEVREHALEMPEEAERAIHCFEAAAPQRAVVARRLRSLITNARPSASSDRHPVAIRLLLIQIEAVANGDPAPLDPFWVGLAAIRSRHGGGAMGDCIMFSLRTMAMAKANPEAKVFAEYLWSVANGGPAGPAPQLTEPLMAAAAEEVRCLADKEVGGISLMVKPAEAKG
jgi:hypothetical protein